jgi:hypothetical protein
VPYIRIFKQKYIKNIQTVAFLWPLILHLQLVIVFIFIKKEKNMKILQYVLALLLVSCGQSIIAGYGKQAVNLDAIKTGIPKAPMCQLVKNAHMLKNHQDWIIREQQKTAAIWRQNQDQILALEAEKVSKLQEELNAQKSQYLKDQAEITDATKPLDMPHAMTPLER